MTLFQQTNFNTNFEWDDLYYPSLEENDEFYFTPSSYDNEILPLDIYDISEFDEVYSIEFEEEDNIYASTFIDVPRDTSIKKESPFENDDTLFDIVSESFLTKRKRDYEIFTPNKKSNIQNEKEVYDLEEDFEELEAQLEALEQHAKTKTGVKYPLSPTQTLESSITPGYNSFPTYNEEDFLFFPKTPCNSPNKEKSSLKKKSKKIKNSSNVINFTSLLSKAKRSNRNDDNNKMYNKKKISSRNDLHYVITEVLPFEQISGIFNLLNFEAENINLEIDILTINDNQYEELRAYVEDCISPLEEEQKQVNKKKKMVKEEKKPKRSKKRQQKPIEEEEVAIHRVAAVKKPPTRKSRKRTLTTSVKKPSPAQSKKRGRKRKAASTSKRPLSSSSSSYLSIENEEDDSSTIYIGPVKSNPLNITRISETKRNHIFGREQIVKLEKNVEDEDEYIDVC